MSETPTYDADRLAQLLEILPGADAIELKLSIPQVEQRTVLDRLGIDSLDAEIRQVAFLDTPDLRLSAAGVVLRARRTQRKPADLTVKLRPMLPADVPAGLRGHKGFKVEVDASPSGYTSSCSLSAEVPDHKIKDLMTGNRRVSRLLSDAQRPMLLDRMPEGLDVDELQVLGPVHLLKCKFAPGGDRTKKMVAEFWLLPDGGRILEISTKSPTEQAFRAAAEAKVFLAQHGADLGAPQEMKTQSVLATFAALVADAAPPAEPMRRDS